MYHCLLNHPKLSRHFTSRHGVQQRPVEVEARWQHLEVADGTTPFYLSPLTDGPNAQHMLGAHPRATEGSHAVCLRYSPDGTSRRAAVQCGCIAVHLTLSGKLSQKACSFRAGYIIECHRLGTIHHFITVINVFSLICTASTGLPLIHLLVCAGHAMMGATGSTGF